MASDGDREAALPPDDAFALLGDETRLTILRTLGEAEEPLSFSALHDRVDVRDSGQFNYHLEKLVGHFVRKTEQGYRLRETGRRVIEAVLSGTVTETPSLDRAQVAEACEYCGAPLEVTWDAGSLRVYCTECAGRYGHAYSGSGVDADAGYLGRLPFPPAGVRNRSPTEAFRAAWTWGHLEVYSLSAGICPRCSATVDRSVTACPDHDAGDGPCSVCDSVYAVNVAIECTNCLYEGGGGAIVGLFATTELLAFLTEHGLNPIVPDSTRRLDRAQQRYEEEVLSRDPLRARFTFTVDDDALSITVDENLDVVETSRRSA